MVLIFSQLPLHGITTLQFLILPQIPPVCYVVVGRAPLPLTLFCWCCWDILGPLCQALRGWTDFYMIYGTPRTTYALVAYPTVCARSVGCCVPRRIFFLLVLRFPPTAGLLPTRPILTGRPGYCSDYLHLHLTVSLLLVDSPCYTGAICTPGLLLWKKTLHPHSHFPIVLRALPGTGYYTTHALYCPLWVVPVLRFGLRSHLCR